MEGPDTVAAVFLEPVQNSGGCFPPPPGYFQRVREICDRHDVLLVSDEVICAFGRLGHMFGCDRYGYLPDIITCAKGMTSGLLADRRHDRVGPDRRAVPATATRCSCTASRSAGTRCPPRSRWRTSTCSSARTCSATCVATRARSGRRSRSCCDLPIVGDVRGDGLLLRHRAREGQGHEGRRSTTTSPSACCAASCPGRCSTPVSLPGRRPRRSGHPARAAAHLRSAPVRRDRADPAGHVDRSMVASVTRRRARSRL